MKDNPTPRRKSYTQSYTRNVLVLLAFSLPGVGNVGDFYKTFFVGGGGEHAYIGFHPSEEQKHRTSLHKTSVLLWQNLRTFLQRSPMFLISETFIPYLAHHFSMSVASSSFGRGAMSSGSMSVVRSGVVRALQTRSWNCCPSRVRRMPWFMMANASWWPLGAMA